MKIIAHRGYSARYTQNTLIAFEKAIEAGVYGIEIDLRLSSDEELIIFHDDNLKNLSGLDKAPEELSLSQLKELNIGDKQKIASLNELLNLADAKVKLILEIKFNIDTYKKLCEKINFNIKDKIEWVEVSCFEDKVLEYMNNLNPKIKLHKLIDNASILKDKNFKKKYKYISYFDINIKLKNIVSQLSLFEKHKIIFWTVENEDISKEKDAGLYAIMKDNPQIN
ncbi:MAG: hypothetical protein COB17_05755 [Sulfurimonas sp.]|nr:MAG: hypothetical protein COB17_05755 [Sulfurimonas sp.]